MTLGNIIKNYREEHDLSMEQFSKISGLSKAYVALLEKNEHPKTKKPITPSIITIKAVSLAIGIDFNSLIDMLDPDQTVRVDVSLQLTEQKVRDSHLLTAFHGLTTEGQQRIIDYADDLVASGRYDKEKPSEED